MKYFLTTLLFLFSFSVFSEEYKFEQFDLNGNPTQEGVVIAFEKDTKRYKFEVDVNGINNGYEFSSSVAIVDGLNIWDIHDRRDPRGISIFTWLIDPKIYHVGFETTEIQTLDKNHPFFKSQGWVFNTRVEKKESLNIGDKKYETIFFHTKGQRPTGPTHTGACYFNQTGVIEVFSWFDSSNGKLIKQIFDKRHCIPDQNRLLSREILTLK